MDRGIRANFFNEDKGAGVASGRFAGGHETILFYPYGRGRILKQRAPDGRSAICGGLVAGCDLVGQIVEIGERGGRDAKLGPGALDRTGAFQRRKADHDRPHRQEQSENRQEDQAFEVPALPCSGFRIIH
ncbi:MAG TPA: hypothetical protein VNH44_04760 [Micropepsaceae bacterium]|nr:hypothetical protein [Micropepsaceae bacterium]